MSANLPLPIVFEVILTHERHEFGEGECVQRRAIVLDPIPNAKVTETRSDFVDLIRFLVLLVLEKIFASAFEAMQYLRGEIPGRQHRAFARMDVFNRSVKRGIRGHDGGRRGIRRICIQRRRR